MNIDFCRKAAATVLVLGLFTGCVTLRETSYVSPEFQVATDKTIEVEDVTVTVDYMNQPDIAWQVAETARGLIRDMQLPSGGPVTTMEIEITQRSYMDGISPKTSIFIDIALRSADGAVIGTLRRGFVGDDTIVSAIVQYREMKNACAKLLQTRKKAR